MTDIVKRAYEYTAECEANDHVGLLIDGLANEVERLQEAVELLRWLDRRGGLGLDVHERIRATLAKVSADGENEQ